MHRRQVLQGLVASGLYGLSPHTFALRGIEQTPPLIVIFLRGAIDGLSVLYPYTDQQYYQLRPDLALTAPAPHDPHRLNTQFALHPSMAALLPYWHNQSLALVQACGLIDPIRSHFEAQHLMEVGGQQPSTQAEGWLNRLLQVLQRRQAHTTALSIGSVVPMILQGQAAVTPVQLGRMATQPSIFEQTQYQALLARLYQAHPLATEYAQAYQSRQRLLAALNADDPTMMQMMEQTQGFAVDALQIATMLKQDGHIPIVMSSVGGWDTHANQGNATQGWLQLHLRRFAEGLATLIEALGEQYQHSTIVVMSEFGRTVQQNGTLGTDHGRANLMWVLGGRIAGGKIYGEWPTLDRDQLFEQRDLPVLIDYRQVISTVLTQHFQLSDAELSFIFPEPWQAVRGLESLWRA